MIDYKIASDFYLSEMTKSTTALKNNIANEPNVEQIIALTALVNNVPQPARTHFGIPFAPSSGFSCLELGKLLGRSETSQHAKGEGVDFEIPGVDNYELALWLSENVTFDQIILEHYVKGQPSSGWVHASYTVHGKNRGDLRHTEFNKDGELHYPSGLV